jgi:hypothetical protein
MLSGVVKVVLGLVETKPIDLGAGSFPLNREFAWRITNGVGAGQADLIWTDTRTLGAGANEDLDLAGVLSSIFGATLAAARLKGLFVEAAAANPNALTLSRPAANGISLFAAAGDAITIRPGGVFAWWAEDATAVPIAGGSADLLNLLAGAGGNHVYDVVVIGASA